jgi:SAM-dependent methyltransferase
MPVIDNPTAIPTGADRAKLSRGCSPAGVHRVVAESLATRHPGGGTLLDIGCGHGGLWEAVAGQFHRYFGADALRYERFPANAEFCAVDLDTGRVGLPDGFADVVASVETIEHLENPRALFREAVRLTKPGGWTAVTTPNQLSLLAKLTLVFKNHFTHFGRDWYPSHLTALLEIDLRRMAAECGLIDVAIVYGNPGRVVLTPRYFPRWATEKFPRACSDNVLVIGRKPADPRAEV